MHNQFLKLPVVALCTVGKQPGNRLQKYVHQHQSHSTDNGIDYQQSPEGSDSTLRITRSQILADNGRTSILKSILHTGHCTIDIIGNSQRTNRSSPVILTHGIDDCFSHRKGNLLYNNRKGNL